MQLLYLILLPAEDLLGTVGFSAVDTDTLNPSANKNLFEQKDKVEPSHLLAGTCFWLPDASCAWRRAPSHPLRSQVQRDKRLQKGLFCVSVLPLGVGAVFVSVTAPVAPRQGLCARSASLTLPCCLPRNPLFLHVGQSSIGLWHSLRGYSEQLQGRAA